MRYRSVQFWEVSAAPIGTLFRRFLREEAFDPVSVFPTFVVTTAKRLWLWSDREKSTRMILVP